MALQQLHTPAQALHWLGQRVPAPSSNVGSALRAPLRTDSRQVQPGDVFLAWPGRQFDGRAHVATALQAGAAACLVEAEGVDVADDARVASLPSLKAHAGVLANDWYGQPSHHMKVLAVTGTNGKTSTAWWLAQALSALGQRCAVMGTLGIGQPPAGGDAAATGALQATGLTTPDAVTVHAALRSLLDQGFAACALEASSIGLVEDRLAGVHIQVALFTNFTQDHLDFHGDMAAYWAAKRRLFDWPGLRAAVVNIDDEQGARLAQELTAQPLDLWTVSLHQAARLRALNLRYVDGGLAMDVLEAGLDEAAGSITAQTLAQFAPQTLPQTLPQSLPLRSALVGDFNASNLLGVLAGLRALGVSLVDAMGAVAGLSPVPGRLQRLSAAGLEVVVDYAHTPDALQKVLQALRPLAQARGGQLWCVMGCGGNRDAGKRPLMGRIAAQGADHVVVTSDNPRDEEPAHIAAQIMAGIDGLPAAASVSTITLLDRRQAIQHAVQQATAGDVLLLAGKGHETTQEVRGVKRLFSDLQEAQAALALRAAATLTPSTLPSPVHAPMNAPMQATLQATLQAPTQKTSAPC